MPRNSSTPGEARPWATWLPLVLALALLHGPALAGHVSYALDPGVFNDDVRQQVFPFFRFSDRDLFKNDFLGDYILAATPVGLRALYVAAATVLDATVLSKALPYLLLLATVAAVVATAVAVGSRWSAFASASLVLGASVFMTRMAGGLARGFAFPFLAVGLALLAAGRLRWLALLVPFAAAFYPPAAVLLGLAAAIAALLLPAGERGDLADWSPFRRLALLGGAALLSGLVVLPQVLGVRGYGPMITPTMVPEYPEAGPDGRYGPQDVVGGEPLLASAAEAVGRALRAGGTPFRRPIATCIPASGDLGTVARAVALAIALLGGASLARRSAATRRILALGVAVPVAHAAARLLSPHLFLPARYPFYALPLLAVVLLPAAAAEVARLVNGSRHCRCWRALAAAAPLAIVAVFGGTGNAHAGLKRLAPAGDRLLAAVSGLPKDVLVAAWPEGPIDNVPYACRRQVLLSRELHQAFQVGFVTEARSRMAALIDAYFATSPEPLLRLRDEFGVTHLLVHLPHLRGTPPRYFHPFDPWIDDAVARAAGRGYLALRLIPEHATFVGGEDVILDLRDLARLDGAPAPSSPVVESPEQPHEDLLFGPDGELSRTRAEHAAAGGGVAARDHAEAVESVAPGDQPGDLVEQPGAGAGSDLQ